MFLNFSEIIQAFLYHPSRGSYTSLAVALAVEDVNFLLVLPIPVSKPKTVVFDGSLSSVGVCHNEGVGAGEVTLFSEQITIKGHAGCRSDKGGVIQKR